MKEFRIFKAGDYGDKGKYTKESLSAIAGKYNEQVTSGGTKSPLSYGHKDDSSAPAAGWVNRLRMDGDFMIAELDPTKRLIKDVEDGSYRNLSAEFYRNGDGFRRLAVLGSAPPHLKDIDSLSFGDAYFSEDEQSICMFSEGALCDLDSVKQTKEEEHDMSEVKLTDEQVATFADRFWGLFKKNQEEDEKEANESAKFADMKADLDKREADINAKEDEVAAKESEVWAKKFCDDNNIAPAASDPLAKFHAKQGEEEAVKFGESFPKLRGDLEENTIKSGDSEPSKFDDEYKELAGKGAFDDIYSDMAAKECKGDMELAKKTHKAAYIEKRSEATN